MGIFGGNAGIIANTISYLHDMIIKYVQCPYVNMPFGLAMI